MTNKIEQFKSIFTEHTDKYLEIITSFTKLEDVLLVKEYGCAAFDCVVNDYCLYFEVYNDGCATVTARKLIRAATWEEPAEYDEKDYCHDGDHEDMKEFFEEIIRIYARE